VNCPYQRRMLVDAEGYYLGVYVCKGVGLPARRESKRRRSFRTFPGQIMAYHMDRVDRRYLLREFGKMRFLS
jgi:hypothetical protein